MIHISEKVIRKYEYKDCRILRIKNIDAIRKIVYDFDKVFKPSLSERIANLNCYTEKLYNNAIVFVAIEENEFIGFTAFYANDRNKHLAYLTQLAVKPKAQNRNIGKLLLDACIDTSKNNGMTELKLEVINSNITAINFYKKNGFELCGESSIYSKYMIKKL